MENNQIEKIYITRDGGKYPDQILIEYINRNSSYFTLSSSYSKKSKEAKEKEEQKMEMILKKILGQLKKEDYDKIVFVSDDDKFLERYVKRSIQQQKIQKETELENLFLTASLGTFALGHFLRLPPSLVFSYLFSSQAIWRNLKIRQLSKKKSKLLKNLKLQFSIFLLGLSLSNYCHSLSVNVDCFDSPYQYQLNQDIDASLDQRRVVLSNLDNPFHGDCTFTTEDAAVDILMGAFDYNPLIEEEDRQIAMNLRQYIEENPYFNYEKCYEDFCSFGIIDTNVDLNSIAAQSFEEYIVIYNKKNVSQDSYKTTLLHELMHRTGHLDNKSLNEGMTTLLVSEYMMDFNIDNNYFDQVLLTKIFCELVTPEKMLEAYSKEDIGIIEDELLKINPDVSDCQNLFKILNEYGFKMHDYGKNGKMEEFFEVESPKFRELFQEAISPYLYHANLEEDSLSRIQIYLNSIGKQMNCTGAVYFNQNSNRLDYVKVYHSNDLSISDHSISYY